ncbi:DUF4810 domain-containing protein [uncultured Duncaniella sp.]|uniref:DUF4810 domain-containing protein n=2 Tax=uncultured Duncaniella sp. TaxID=2768039 RepID=UPI00262515E3|nr:DUF4810 domain-containing protein [uncultured Duncaniella sp.]
MKHLTTKIVAVSCLVFLTASCMPTTKTLYSWGDYEKASYEYTKDPSDKNTQKLHKCFDQMESKQKGTRKTVPPGICAEKAYLLVKQGKTDEALAMLDKEIKLYPESKPFIEKIKKQITQ